MRRALTVAAVAVLMLGASSTPASAHSVSGAGTTNYRTRLKAVSPRVPGVTVRVIDNGRRLELANVTDQEVVVFGYLGEPYLRVGRKGVFENIFSPARYLNVSSPGSAMPTSADAAAAPTWRQVSAGHVARWHEHRIHWMGEQDPPQVRTAPDREHVIMPSWKVPMMLGATAIEANGDLTWVPGPNPLPWLLFAIGLGVGVLFLNRRSRSGRLLVPAMAALVAVDVIHAFGVGLSAAGPLTTRLGSILPGNMIAALAWASAGIGMAWLHWRKPAGFLFLAAAALVIVFEGGIVDLGDLSGSQIPFAFPLVMARFLVAASLGLGAAVAASSALIYASHHHTVPVDGQPLLTPAT